MTTKETRVTAVTNLIWLVAACFIAWYNWGWWAVLLVVLAKARWIYHDDGKTELTVKP